MQSKVRNYLFSRKTEIYDEVKPYLNIAGLEISLPFTKFI